MTRNATQRTRRQLSSRNSAIPSIGDGSFWTVSGPTRQKTRLRVWRQTRNRVRCPVRPCELGSFETHARKALGPLGFQLYRLASKGMHHTLLPCVKHEALATAPPTIERVTNNGMPRMCQMHANLMAPASLQFNLQKRLAMLPRKHTHKCDRGLSAPSDPHPLGIMTVSPNRPVEPEELAITWPRSTLHNSQIALAHVVPCHLRVKCRLKLTCKGKEHEAGGTNVESLNRLCCSCSPHAQKQRLHTRSEGVGSGAVGMHKNARWLINGHQQPVLVDDLHGTVARGRLLFCHKDKLKIITGEKLIGAQKRHPLAPQSTTGEHFASLFL